MKFSAADWQNTKHLSDPFWFPIHRVTAVSAEIPHTPNSFSAPDPFEDLNQKTVNHHNPNMHTTFISWDFIIVVNPICHSLLIHSHFPSYLHPKSKEWNHRQSTNKFNVKKKRSPNGRDCCRTTVCRIEFLSKVGADADLFCKFWTRFWTLDICFSSLLDGEILLDAITQIQIESKKSEELKNYVE